jgi:hypothetical protein
MKQNIDHIDLKLNLEKGQKFYNRFLIEKTIMGECSSTNEQKEIIHITWQKQPSGKYLLQSEVFNKMRNNKNMSHSEEDFLNMIGSIQDNIILEIDEYGNLLDIYNFNTIQQKANKVIEKLSKKFKGKEAEYTYIFLNRYYQNKKIIYKDLNKYDNYGFFLNHFYNKYKQAEKKEYFLNYRNFIKNSYAIVNEQRRIKDCSDNCTTIDISGNLSSENGFDFFKTEMLFRNIPFTSSDNPNLDKYKGEISFSTKTGELLYSDLLIEFSYGDNYKKTIEYEIKEINYEEL